MKWLCSSLVVLTVCGLGLGAVRVLDMCVAQLVFGIVWSVDWVIGVVLRCVVVSCVWWFCAYPGSFLLSC